MSDGALSPINSNVPPLINSGAAAQPAPRTPLTPETTQPADGLPAQAQAGVGPQASQAAAASPEPQKVEPKKVEKEQSALPITNQENISIRFQVDEKTNQVMVYVVDRQSKQVLRTIPPGELSKLSAGDLIRLSA